MFSTRRPRLSYANVAATVALVVAVAGTAVASIPAPGGVIKGCYKKNGGGLRVIDSSKKCSGSEKPLKWNSKGRSGISEALVTFAPANVTVDKAGVLVARLDVPVAGAYVAFAKATVETSGPGMRLIICRLQGGAAADFAAAGLGAPGTPAVQTISFNQANLFTGPGKFEIMCDSAAPVVVSSIKITALRVDQLQAQTSQP